MSLQPPEWVPQQKPPPMITPRRPVSGDSLALWGMFVGLVGILLSPFGGGILLGMAGLVLAGIAQSRPLSNKARVTAASGLSIVALLFSVYASVGGIEGLLSGGIRRWEGVRAPDFTVTTLKGDTLKLSDLRGKRVFIDIWATWCPPCRAMQPDLDRLAKEWADKGVVVVGLSADGDKQDLEDYARHNKFDYSVGWMGPDFPKPYGDVGAFPTLFVVDKDGVIVAVEVGQHAYGGLTALAGLPDYGGAPKPTPKD